jgi:phage baseplate assembly protein V
MIDQLRKIIAPLQRRIFMAIARGIVKNVDDASTIQKLQLSLLADEVIDRLEHIQHYGFTSVPKSGAEAVALFIAGNRDHGVVIATDDRRYRKKDLASGEVALYTDEGDYIHFKRNGEIVVLAAAKVSVTAPNVEIIASAKVTLTSPSVEASGNLVVLGNISGVNVTASGAVTAVSVVASGAVAAATVTAGGVGISDIKSAYNSHTHTSAAPGAPTGAPLPVIP